MQDQGSNFTRFICISKNLEIYPGADRTSLMAVLPHEPGSLCRVLSRFYALGLNLNKLESRPMPERNFEFMFYFDLETLGLRPGIFAAHGGAARSVRGVFLSGQLQRGGLDAAVRTAGGNAGPQLFPHDPSPS